MMTGIPPRFSLRRERESRCGENTAGYGGPHPEDRPESDQSKGMSAIAFLLRLFTYKSKSSATM